MRWASARPTFAGWRRRASYRRPTETTRTGGSGGGRTWRSWGGGCWEAEHSPPAASPNRGGQNPRAPSYTDPGSMGDPQEHEFLEKGSAMEQDSISRRAVMKKGGGVRISTMWSRVIFVPQAICLAFILVGCGASLGEADACQQAQAFVLSQSQCVKGKSGVVREIRCTEVQCSNFLSDSKEGTAQIHVTTNRYILWKNNPKPQIDSTADTVQFRRHDQGWRIE